MSNSPSGVGGRDAGVKDGGQVASGAGGKPDAAAGGAAKSCKIDAPHVIPSGCYHVCEKGFADCDGDIANGCEVALGTPESCQQCHAMSCFAPDVCGQTEPTCQTVEGNIVAYPVKNGELPVRDLAIGAKPGDVIASAFPAPADATSVTLPAFDGAVFGLSVVGKGAGLWSASGKATSYSSSVAAVRRIGDRLYIIDSREDANYRSQAVLIVASLDGVALWNKVIADTAADLCATQVAADAQNNVFFAYNVCETESTSADYVLDGKTYDAEDGDLVVAYDASGAQRWHLLPITRDVIPCRNGAENQLLGLISAGDRLFASKESCLAEIDPASGMVKAAKELYVEMDDYAVLRTDSAGNLYVGGDVFGGEVLLTPNAVRDASESHPGGSGAFVSKYRPDLTHVWSHAFVHRGKFGGTKEVDPWFRSFDITPAGSGILLAQVGERSEALPLLVAFDSDGKITGAAQLPKGRNAAAVAIDSAGTAYVAGSGGTVASGSQGIFVQTVTLK